jgi:hypothetical protein
MAPRLAVKLRSVHHGPRRTRRALSSSPAYDSTLAHLRIGAHTRVIFQGFTGKLATANARESLAWGTRVVGGVGRGGAAGDPDEHLGLPVFASVRAAAEALRPDASAVYAVAPRAGAAIEEAVAAEVPLIVAVAEHIPLHDMLRVSPARLKSASPHLLAPVFHCALFQAVLDVSSSSQQSRRSTPSSRPNPARASSAQTRPASSRRPDDAALASSRCRRSCPGLLGSLPRAGR